MIQDIGPHIFHNEYKNCFPQTDSVVLFFDGQSVLAHLEGGEIVYPSYGELKSQPRSLRYLFSIDSRAFFLINNEPDAGLLNYQYISIQALRQAGPKHLVFAGITAHQLYKWYRKNLHCGRCGCILSHSENERMLECEICGNMMYPKISPAVIIGVVDRDRLLLIKHTGGYKNYALIAGFAEVGETIEQTVAREVMEEVGLRVKNIRYYKSQPWALSESLLLGFYAELDGDSKTLVDGKEVAEALWFLRKEIPVEPNDFSLTNEMIIRFKNGEEESR